MAKWRAARSVSGVSKKACPRETRVGRDDLNRYDLNRYDLGRRGFGRAGLGRVALALGCSVVGGVALSGCGVPALQNPKVLNTLVGQSALEIVQRFGVPSRTFQTQGHVFLDYSETQSNFSDPDPGWGWGWGGMGYGWDGPWGGWGAPGWGWGPGWGWDAPIVTTSTCQTTFELVNDRVTGWKMRGDGC